MARARAGNQFYGALIPMFLAHDHHDEKDPYLVASELKLRGTLVELHSVLTKSTAKSQTGTCIGMMMSRSDLQGVRRELA